MKKRKKKNFKRFNKKFEANRLSKNQNIKEQERHIKTVSEYIKAGKFDELLAKQKELSEKNGR